MQLKEFLFPNMSRMDGVSVHAARLFDLPIGRVQETPRGLGAFFSQLSKFRLLKDKSSIKITTASVHRIDYTGLAFSLSGNLRLNLLGITTLVSASSSSPESSGDSSGE